MSNDSHYKVGCDAHPGQPARAGKNYSLFAVRDGKGKVLDRVRVNHERGAIQGFLSQFPPGDLRDERELPRTRMAFSKVRTMLKNRIHSTLAKYGLSLDIDSDIFSRKWHPQLSALLQQLPAETLRCVEQELELLDLVQGHIDRLEARMLERVRITPTIQLVMSLPGPAEIPWPAARAGSPSSSTGSWGRSIAFPPLRIPAATPAPCRR